MAKAEFQTLRKQAEAAVDDMPDGPLKVKAFEVILEHLLGQSKNAATDEPAAKASSKGGGGARSTNPRSAVDRIIMLKGEAFFASQRSIGEVRDELARHGWHYPLSSLSGKLQSIVRRRELRRMMVVEGKKSIWKYSEP